MEKGFRIFHSGAQCRFHLIVAKIIATIELVQRMDRPGLPAQMVDRGVQFDGNELSIAAASVICLRWLIRFLFSRGQKKILSKSLDAVSRAVPKSDLQLAWPAVAQNCTKT